MRTRRVLVVENDKEFNFILTKWLSNPLYGVTTVQSAEDAVNLLKERDWDLIISDVNLPNMSGMGLLIEARKFRPDCKVILISGYATLDMAVDAINSHADMFLLKPIAKNDFLNKVDSVLQSKSVSKRKRVLAIGAHPDDVEIGCGGVLLKHINAGDEVHILTLTYGSKGGNCAVRFNEAKRSAQAMGASLHLENLPDTDIKEGSETIKCIERLVKRINPNVVYTHSLNDAHQDHRNVHKASIVACRSVETLECYQSPSSTIQFQPSRFVDISNEFKEKLDLLHCYRSQIEKCDYLKDEVIESNALYWGRFAQYKLVEPLEVVRTL